MVTGYTVGVPFPRGWEGFGPDFEIKNLGDLGEFLGQRTQQWLTLKDFVPLNPKRSIELAAEIVRNAYRCLDNLCVFDRPTLPTFDDVPSAETALRELRAWVERTDVESRRLGFV